MKDSIFVRLVETENSAKLNLDSCKFEGLYFYKISTETKLDIPIVKEFKTSYKKLYLAYLLEEKLNTKLRSLVCCLNQHQSTTYLFLKTKHSRSA